MTRAINYLGERARFASVLTAVTIAILIGAWVEGQTAAAIAGAAI